MKEDESGLSTIVKTVACVVSVPAIVFGFYVIIHGHLTPGGGFPGGVVIASVVALFLVSFGKKELQGKLSRSFFSVAEAVGLIGFIGLAFLGLRNTFFHNFLANSGKLFGSSVAFGVNSGCLWTGGTIPLMNLMVGLEVFAALSLILVRMFVYEGEGND